MLHTNAPAIDDLLADPIIQMVMKADRVEPVALKGLLVEAAGKVRAAKAPRPLAFNPFNVRFGCEARRETLRLAPPAGYTAGDDCLRR